MRIAAERLTWHDAGIDAVHYERSARRLVWQVEVFRWDIGEDGDAESGHLVFEDVEGIEARYDIVDKFSPEPPWFWDVLDGLFERSGENLRCKFLISLQHPQNPLGGPSYEELEVTCRAAWYMPAQDNTAWGLAFCL